jgi:hypothetical protein
VRFNNPAKRDDRPRHLIRRFLRLGYCATLLGKRESGKRDLATAIALAVAEGKAFAGMPATQGGVLWLSSEDPYDRERALRPIRHRLENLPFFVTYDRPAIDTAEGLEDISTWISKAQARLIVVDSLAAAHSGGIGWDARATLAAFKRLCYQAGVTGLVLHTIRTTAKPAIEASHFAAATDIAMYQFYEQTRKGRRITLHATGRGDDSNWTLRLDSPASYEYQRVLMSTKTPEFTHRFTLDDEVLACIAASPVPLSAKSISDRIDRNPNSIRNALARLQAAGSIRFSHHANQARHYRIHAETPGGESRRK